MEELDHSEEVQRRTALWRRGPAGVAWGEGSAGDASRGGAVGGNSRRCPHEAAEEVHRSCLRWRRRSSTRQAMLEELQSSGVRCVMEEVQKNRESGRRETPVFKS